MLCEMVKLRQKRVMEKAGLLSAGAVASASPTGASTLVKELEAKVASLSGKVKLLEEELAAERQRKDSREPLSPGSLAPSPRALKRRRV